MNLLALLAGLGALVLWRSAPVGVALTAIAAVTAAIFSVGLTLGWKALDAFSDAIREAQKLPKSERVAFRASSRRRRAVIAAFLAVLSILCALAGAAVLVARERGIASELTPWLLYGGGACAGLALMVFFGLFRQYFSGDDLIAEIKDRIDDHEARTRQLEAMAHSESLDEKIRASARRIG